MKLATLCYIEKDNQYLMLHRVKKEGDMHKGLWVGLGGKFEAGESPDECVIREVFEESGLSIISPQLKGMLTFPGGFDGEDWYVFLFTVSRFLGVLKECTEGNLAWIDKDKLGELPMHEGDKLFTQWMQENKGIFSVKFEYDACDASKLRDYHISHYSGGV